MHLHLVESAPLRVEYQECFWDSYLLLDHSTGTFSALMALIEEAALMAEGVPTVTDSRMRVLRTIGTSDYPALRLYFLIEDGTLKYMWVARYYD